MANGNGTATKPKVELALNESATLKLHEGQALFGREQLRAVLSVLGDVTKVWKRPSSPARTCISGSSRRA